MFLACFCSCINIHEGDEAANHVPPTQRVYCYVMQNEALHAPACVACVTYCVMENYHTPRPLAAFILFRVRCADGFSKLIIVISAVAAVVAVSMIRSCVRPSVRLSVCPITRPQPRRAVGLLLSAMRATDIDRQQRRPAGVAQHGTQQQTRAVSRLRPT